MTTNNLQGLEGIDELVGHIAPQVPKRRSEIRKEVDGRRKHEANVAVGAAAAIQRSRDKRAELDEEDDQLANVERMAAEFLQAFDRDSSEEELAPQPWSEPPVSMATPPPPPPTSGAVVSEPESHVEPGQPQDRTDVIPVVRSEQVRVHALDVRHWDGRQWLVAAIGLLIGLVVATFTWHPLVATGHIYGSGRSVFVAFWFICLGGIGFFGGGHLGYQTEERGGDWEEA